MDAAAADDGPAVQFPSLQGPGRLVGQVNHLGAAPARGVDQGEPTVAGEAAGGEDPLDAQQGQGRHRLGDAENPGLGPGRWRSI